MPCPSPPHPLGSVLPARAALYPSGPSCCPLFPSQGAPPGHTWGSAVFTGNPCMGTGGAWEGRSVETWQPGLAMSAAPSNNHGDARHCVSRVCAPHTHTLFSGRRGQKANRARRGILSVAPGLGCFSPAERFFQRELRRGGAGPWRPLLWPRDAGLLGGRSVDPADPETPGEGKAAGHSCF